MKDRRQVFDDDISKGTKELFEHISPKYNITLQEWNHDKDHIHILFRVYPSTEISKFINAYKSASSRLLKKEFPQIWKKRWKKYFWRQSFWLRTFYVQSLKYVFRNSNPRNSIGNISVKNGYIKLQKIGFVKWKQYRTVPFDYRLKSGWSVNSVTSRSCRKALKTGINRE